MKRTRNKRYQSKLKFRKPKFKNSPDLEVFTLNPRTLEFYTVRVYSVTTCERQLCTLHAQQHTG